VTDQPEAPKRARWGVVALISLLAAVIVAFVVIGVLTAAGTPKAAASSPAAAPVSLAPTPTSTPSPSPSVTVKPKAEAKAKAKAKATVAPTPVPAGSPQPTRTATISKPTAIVKSLTAKVTRMEAVQGKADGPGEISGPSVRFTIAISNSTGKTVDLSNTVVNAYYGADSTPAIELRMPGGRTFPSSVKSGSTATGVYLFNIPTASRGKVEVTVDTSVRNPVVAFRGSAPR
jgi:cytoskeletal protein RodZ